MRALLARLPWRELISFGLIGGSGVLLYAAVFYGFQLFLPSFWANLLTLMVTTVYTTGLNRAFTFRVHGRTRLGTHHLQGLIIFAVTWLLTSAVLAIYHLLQPVPVVGVELTLLVTANLSVTLLKFLAFKFWVFRKKEEYSAPA